MMRMAKYVRHKDTCPPGSHKISACLPPTKCTAAASRRGIPLYPKTSILVATTAIRGVLGHANIAESNLLWTLCSLQQGSQLTQCHTDTQYNVM